MNILFLHRNFPGQFKSIIMELSKDPNNNIVFVTNNKKTPAPKTIKKYVYNLKREVLENCHRYLRFCEEAVIHGQSAAETVIHLRNTGFKPDVIYGHTWGPTLFMKEIFPDVPLICYFEWYYNPVGTDVDFDGHTLNEDEKSKLKSKNTYLLLDLVSCDAGICPTAWQKSQFPEEFQHKIKLLHDGVDTNLCKPNNNAEFIIKEKNLKFTPKDEVITYATRGMEEYRGFPEFMKAVEKLQKSRPNLQVVIAGEDRVCYGKKLNNDTFKQKMLRELDLDLKRIHFAGNLPYLEYIKLLQITSAHVYLTYPFVLSWSLLEAMATGCNIAASNTAPVKEVIQDNFNGLLVDFYDVEQLTQKIEYILDNKKEVEYLGVNARTSILEKYDVKKLLPQHVEFIRSVL
jgi:glycosyltransferase involved in cell wall biosynthesis